MNNSDIDSILTGINIPGRFKKQENDDITLWQFTIADTPAFIQTQTAVNRMRIVAKIGHPKYQERSDLRSLMEANYHSALDCRYAITDGRLVATFIHPLAELTKAEFKSGLAQVISCTLSCGRENSGGTLTFGKTGEIPHHDRKSETLENLFSNLGQARFSGTNLNVNVYQGNVDSTKVVQQSDILQSDKPKRTSSFDWIRYVIVPLLVSLIAILTAVIKGWLG